MYKQIAAAASVLCVLYAAACSSGPTNSSQTIEGSSNLVTEIRQLSKFTSINMTTVGSVNISLGAAQKVSVTVNQNLMQYIRTSVQGATLVIETEQGHRYSNLDLTVDLTMAELDKVNLTGVGVVRSTGKLGVDFLDLNLTGAGEIDLTVESLLVKSVHSGAGNITLSGEADRHEIAHSGAGSLKAFDLITEDTIINHSGAGRVEVYADVLLDVTITGAGSVYYRGHPTIVKAITGAGQLIDDN